MTYEPMSWNQRDSELAEAKQYIRDLENRLWVLEGEVKILQGQIVKLERVKDLWREVVLNQPPED